MQTATVKYQYGTYSGTVTVSVDENDDNDMIIARARGQLKRKGLLTLSMAYESWKVVSREDD